MLRPQKPSLGGNALLKPKNNTKCKTKDEKKEAARCRAANNLNCTVEQLENFAVIYKNLVCGAKTAGCVYESQDGMIAAFLGKGLSEVQIRSFLPVGGHKVQRIRNELKDPSLREKRNMPRVPSHAVSDEDIERLVEQAKEWDLEDGFACSHRRIKRYFKEKEGEEALTWAKLHLKYKTAMETINARAMSKVRWREYVRAIFPNVRLSRAKEDECDTCVAINIELADESISEERRQELLLVKSVHIDEAITQRRAMSAFIRQFVGAIDPDQVLPNEILPDYVDDFPEDEDIADDGEEHVALTIDGDEEPPITLTPGTVQVQAEDFAGSFALPHYGFLRPSSDFYHSNLMQLAVIHSI